MHASATSVRSRRGGSKCGVSVIADELKYANQQKKPTGCCFHAILEMFKFAWQVACAVLSHCVLLFGRPKGGLQALKLLSRRESRYIETVDTGIYM